MLRIAMIGIAGVLLALQVKALKPEYGIYLCLAVSLLVFLQMTDLLGMILAGLQTVQESLPLQAGYFKILLKIIGITYIAEFASDLCKDAGYATIAGQIQMFGKLSVLADRNSGADSTSGDHPGIPEVDGKCALRLSVLRKTDRAA